MKTYRTPARIAGLDTLRFFCAFAVLLSHVGYTLINGPAAVIVFFVISGFCIHYPSRSDLSLQGVLPYYVRRLVRIGLPATAAIICYYLAGLRLEPPYYGVFWSIICELVYYLLYPVLLRLRKRYGWTPLNIVSLCVAMLYVAMRWTSLVRSSNYFIFGTGSWIIGLPCWLAGCWLAEHFNRFAVPSRSAIWLIRADMFLLATMLRIAKFKLHHPLASNMVSLTMFGFIACLWIGYEIAYYSKNSPYAWWEAAGQWSYSLYIMHPVILHVGLTILTLSLPFKVMLILPVLAASFLFFKLVEEPAHKLAVHLSKRSNPDLRQHNSG